MTDDDRMELGLLRRNADSLGLYVNEHRDFDPCRGSDGPLYIQEKRKFREARAVTLLKYASIEQVWQFLGDYRSKQNAQ